MGSVNRKEGDRIYAGREFDERLAERRQKFVEAGIRLFGTVGYHAVTVRVLVAEAGLVNRYFYESFDSIEEVLIASYQFLMDGFRRNLLESIGSSSSSLEDKVRVGVTCYFQAIQDPCFARIIQVEILGVSPQVDAVYIKASREFAQIITSLMGSLANVHLSEVDAEILGRQMTGAMTISGYHWFRSGYLHPIERLIENTVTLVMGTVERLQRLQ